MSSRRSEPSTRPSPAAAIRLPSGYSIFWSGQYEYMLRAKQRLMIVVPLTLLIILLIIYLNTRSLVKTAIVLLAVPVLPGRRHLDPLPAQLQPQRRRLGRPHRPGGLGRRDRRRHAALPRPGLRAVAAGRPACAARPDLRDAIYHGAVKRVRPKAMTAAVIIAGLLPILWSHGAGADVMKRIATPMIGGVVTSTIMELAVYPAIFFLWRSRRLKEV